MKVVIDLVNSFNNEELETLVDTLVPSYKEALKKILFPIYSG